jgi:hypothetical protein
VEAITRALDPLAMALRPEAAGRIYLAMVNGDGSFLVLHNLARFEEPAGMRSRAGGRIAAFEREVRDNFGLPRLLQFDEPDNNLFVLDLFPLPALHGVAMFYHQDGENNLRFHNKIVPSPPGGQRYSCLIPVPTEWAPWFLDNPDLDTTFRHLIFLMQEVEQDDRELFRHFAASITYACGLPDPRANYPVSALLSKWRWMTYSKATLHWATAQWEGHPVINNTVAQRKEPLAPAANEFDCLFGRAQTPAGGVPPIHRARGSHHHRTQLASASLSPDNLRGGGSCGSNNPPPSHGLCNTDIGIFTALLKAQSDSQIAINKANYQNFIAFHTATVQALAAKGSDKDSKLTATKKWILQVCMGEADGDSFVPEPVF